jgi:hypothetical protein
MPNWKPWVHSVQPRDVYLPGDGEDRGALGGVPRGVDGADFLAGEFEQAGGLFLELLWSELGVDFHKTNDARCDVPEG